MRHARSSARATRVSTRPTVTSASSPAWCPYWSLKRLKWSTSIITRPTQPPARWARLSSTSSASSKARRLPRPVRASAIDCCSSRCSSSCCPMAAAIPPASVRSASSCWPRTRGGPRRGTSRAAVIAPSGRPGSPAGPGAVMGTASTARSPSRQVRSSPAGSSRLTVTSQPGSRAAAVPWATVSISSVLCARANATDAACSADIRSPRRRSSRSLTADRPTATTTTMAVRMSGPSQSAAGSASPSIAIVPPTTRADSTAALTPLVADRPRVAASAMGGSSQRAGLSAPPESRASASTTSASSTRPASTAASRRRGQRAAAHCSSAWTAIASAQAPTARARSRALMSRGARDRRDRPARRGRSPARGTAPSGVLRGCTRPAPGGAREGCRTRI